MRDVRRFLRANPQVMILLLVCLVLGIGTFLAVIFGIASAGSDQTTGDPSGSVGQLHAALRPRTPDGDPSRKVGVPGASRVSS